jgi:hypothetical protein
MFEDERPAYTLVGETGDEVRPLVIDQSTGQPIALLGLRRRGRA